MCSSLLCRPYVHVTPARLTRTAAPSHFRACTSQPLNEFPALASCTGPVDSAALHNGRFESEGAMSSSHCSLACLTMKSSTRAPTQCRNTHLNSLIRGMVSKSDCNGGWNHAWKSFNRFPSREELCCNHESTPHALSFKHLKLDGVNYREHTEGTTLVFHQPRALNNILAMLIPRGVLWSKFLGTGKEINAFPFKKYLSLSVFSLFSLF